MTTFAELQTKVARAIADVDNQVFTSDVVKDMIYQGLAEVGRLAPVMFQEDITPVADQLEYQLQAVDLPNATPEIEVSRVEVWDTSDTPARFQSLVQPASAQPYRLSEGGWEVWNGTLRIPNRVEDYLVPEDHTIKVWGYRPYVTPTVDADVLECSAEQEQAVLAYIKVEALKALIASRDLFTQWQTRTNNTDVSPASLMNQLSLAEDSWRRKARSILRLRE